MKSTTVILIILFSIPIFLYAQSELPKRWTFSVSAGATIPVGVYGKNDNVTIYSPEPCSRFIGFNKSKSGFAKIGYHYNATIQFNLNSGIALLLRSGKLIHSVYTEQLSNYLTALFNGTVEAEHINYDVFYITPGIGYYKSFNKFKLGLDIFMGYTNSNYPYYKGVLLYTTTNPPLTWAHDGARPKLNALMMGSSLYFGHNISPTLAIGIELMYQKADFDYVITTRVIPGYDLSPVTDDTVKLRVFNTGFKIGYMF